MGSTILIDLHEYLEGPYLIPTQPHPATGEKLPVIIGHEFSGVVTEVGGNVKDMKPGDNVVVQPIIFDRKCNSCQKGLINCCQTSGFIGLSGKRNEATMKGTLDDSVLIQSIYRMGWRSRGIHRAPKVVCFPYTKGNPFNRWR